MIHQNLNIDKIIITPCWSDQDSPNRTNYRIVKAYFHGRNICSKIIKKHEFLIDRFYTERTRGLLIQIKELHFYWRRLIQIPVASGHFCLILVRSTQIQLSHHVFHVALRPQDHHFIVDRTDHHSRTRDIINRCRPAERFRATACSGLNQQCGSTRVNPFLRFHFLIGIGTSKKRKYNKPMQVAKDEEHNVFKLKATLGILIKKRINIVNVLICICRCRAFHFIILLLVN